VKVKVLRQHLQQCQPFDGMHMEWQVGMLRKGLTDCMVLSTGSWCCSWCCF
jgi:hypothetical protein